MWWIYVGEKLGALVVTESLRPKTTYSFCNDMYQSYQPKRFRSIMRAAMQLNGKEKKINFI